MVTGYKAQEEQPPCPRCGGCLFEQQNDFYCLCCNLQFCPICLHGYGMTIDGEDFRPCDHYVGEYCGGSGEHYDFLGGNSEPLAALITPDGVFDGLEGGERDRINEAAGALSEAERLSRFGPLHPMLDDVSGDLGSALYALGIPFRVSYVNMSGYITTYFTPLGYTAAWQLLSPALALYGEGLNWLERVGLGLA